MSQLEWKEFAGPTSVLIASIITQLVTVIILFENQNLSYKRYAKEKLWDLKRELYSKIISKLSDMHGDYVKAHALYTIEGADEEFKRNALSNEKAFFDKLLEAQTFFQDNQPIFSKAFSDNFQAIYKIHRSQADTAFADYAFVLLTRRNSVRDIHASLLKQSQIELGTLE